MGFSLLDPLILFIYKLLIKKKFIQKNGEQSLDHSLFKSLIQVDYSIFIYHFVVNFTTVLNTIWLTVSILSKAKFQQTFKIKECGNSNLKLENDI